ncbi:MAG: LLM class flavin-dependent oxidoreductase, partial [Candidatus Binatia bacterium]
MEFGLQVASMELPKFRDVAQAAEGLGYDLITFPDHIVMEQPEGQYDPKTLMWDPMIVAATVCDATKKIRVGHLVLCNLFRHPAIAAQSLA